MSHSIHRRRRWRTCATTLALTLGSLAVPAAALADGQLDPAFNGTGYHVGTAAEGTVFNNADNRIPMVVAGRRQRRHRRLARRLHDACALQRRRHARHDVRRRRLRHRAVRRHARQRPGQQWRHRDDARRRRQHHRRRLRRARSRWSSARFIGQRHLQRRSRLLRAAPDRLHGPRLAVRPNGSVVLVGYARDRHAGDRRSRHAGRDVRPARRRHAAGRPGTQHDRVRHLLGQRRPLARLGRRDDRRPQPRRHRRSTPRSRRPLLRRRRGARRQPLRRRHRPTAPTPTSARATRLAPALHGSRRRPRHDVQRRWAPAASCRPRSRADPEREPARDQAAAAPTSLRGRRVHRRDVAANRQMLVARIDTTGAFAAASARAASPAPGSPAATTPARRWSSRAPT